MLFFDWESLTSLYLPHWYISSHWARNLLLVKVLIDKMYIDLMSPSWNTPLRRAQQMHLGVQRARSAPSSSDKHFLQPCTCHSVMLWYHVISCHILDLVSTCVPLSMVRESTWRQNIKRTSVFILRPWFGIIGQVQANRSFRVSPYKPPAVALTGKELQEIQLLQAATVVYIVPYVATP